MGKVVYFKDESGINSAIEKWVPYTLPSWTKNGVVEKIKAIAVGSFAGKKAPEFFIPMKYVAFRRDVEMSLEGLLEPSKITYLVTSINIHLLPFLMDRMEELQEQQ